MCMRMRINTRNNRVIWQVICIMVIDDCVFFFQAEDGIRDLTVTGVQTCALPIYASLPLLAAAIGVNILSVIIKAVRWWLFLRPTGITSLPLATRATVAGAGLNNVRSEERRVGKECRSRWSPYH